MTRHIPDPGKTRTANAPPAKPVKDKKKSRKTKEAKPNTDPIIDIGVTIISGGGDIDPSILTRLSDFINDMCIAGLFSLERGDTAYNLQAQGVVRIQACSAQTVTARLKKHLAEFVDPYLQVRTQTLAGTGIHTFTGMLGYCTKDRTKSWYQTVSQNVTDDEIAQGQVIHSQHG